MGLHYICSLRLASAIANLGQGELGKRIRKDSDESDLPACKGTLAICPALGINFESAIVMIFIEAFAISSHSINNTFHSTRSVIRSLKCVVCVALLLVTGHTKREGQKCLKPS